MTIFGTMFSALKSIKIGVFLSFVNLLIQGTSFLVQNAIARNLGNSRYGYFGILQNDSMVFTMISDFGMSTLIIAFFAKRATEGRLFQNVLRLKVFAALATMLAMLAFTLIVRHDHAVFYGELVMILGILLSVGSADWYFTCGSMWKKLLTVKILQAVSYALVMSVAFGVFKISSIEAIAFSSILAAVPPCIFGVAHMFSADFFKIKRRTLRFIGLMYKAAFPYALSSLASLAYLPAGFYFVDHFAHSEYLSAYGYSHKLIAIASAFMVNFISSSLLQMKRGASGKISLKGQLLFTLFIAACASPLYLVPEWVLRILFFGANWDAETLAASAFVLRLLSISLPLQALRMPCISLLLKEKLVWKYVAFISIGGVINLAACYFGISYTSFQNAAIFTLAGDVVLTLLLLIDQFTSNNKQAPTEETKAA